MISKFKIPESKKLSIELLTKIESKFRDGMSWENYGNYWHIDHIKPCCLYNMTIKEQRLECFNYKNLQPLLAEENLSKNNRIDKEQIEQHCNHLLKYHKENNIEMPQEFIDLFAKYLVAGSPLEPILSNK